MLNLARKVSLSLGVCGDKIQFLDQQGSQAFQDEVFLRPASSPSFFRNAFYYVSYLFPLQNLLYKCTIIS